MKNLLKFAHFIFAYRGEPPTKDRRALLDHFFGYLRVKLHRLQPEQPALKNTAPGPGATGTAAWSLCRDITNQ